MTNCSTKTQQFTFSVEHYQQGLQGREGQGVSNYQDATTIQCQRVTMLLMNGELSE